MKQNNEELYKEFYENMLNGKNSTATEKPFIPTKQDVQKPIQDETIVQAKTPVINIPEKNKILSNELNTRFEDIKLSEIPLGEFYFPSTRIMFRDLTVEEIEHISTLDSKYLANPKETIDDILDSCLRVTRSDGSIGSYIDILEGDRIWLVYTIREKTFMKRNKLSVKVKYIDENDEQQSLEMELIRENLDVYRNEEIMEFFDKSKRCFVFNTTLREEPYLLAPPTIGLKKCFDAYLKYKTEEGKVNKAFFLIAPFLKPHVNHMDYEELSEFERWFSKEITTEEFAFLDDIIKNEMKIGIRGLKKNQGGKVIRTKQLYPARLSTLFSIPNAFRVFIKK